MKTTSEMSTKLFNELTDIQSELEKITERIKQIQIEAEEIYIDQNE